MSTGHHGPQSATPPRYAEIDIAGLTADSRQVRPGYLFAALPGARYDGRDFIDDAVARGAAAVLAPTGTVLDRRHGAAVALVTDERPRARLAHLAAAFYHLQPAHVAAVTGTDGKSSVVDMARQIWLLLGTPAASIGTLGIVCAAANDGESVLAAPGLTSPDPVLLHERLAALAASGIDHVALEASSHGLDQNRLDAVRLTAAVFTSFGRDHLDYHRDTASYFAAKARLFDDLLPPHGRAILNADMPESDALAARCRARGQTVLRYGRAGDALKLFGTVAHAHGQTIDVELFGARHEVDVTLVGAFQAHNLLAAIAVAAGETRDAAAVAAVLGQVHGVRGRMELAAKLPNGAGVFVDYAHTPGALQTALTALRPHTANRITVVIGAGGDRDRGKRPLMGRAAAAHADRVIVTDDNPRSEAPADIRREILAGCPQAREIGDRGAAIAAAIDGLGPGDSLLIAGKGHETGQIVGAEVRPFDDRAVAQVHVAQKFAVPGAPR